MNDIFEEIERIDNELFKATYIDKDFKKRDEIWDSIKNNNKVLEMAISVVRDKFGSKNIFLGPSIVEKFLIEYRDNPSQISLFDDINKYNELYQELVNSIYSNKDLARYVLDGSSNGGYSFLLYTLFNDNLTLNEKQKEFAINEAMNKFGTIKYEEMMNDLEKRLDENGITNDSTIILPEIGPIGRKTGILYARDRYLSLSTSQAHGIGDFDIRYYILKNPNFSNEFEKLVYDFYSDDNYFNNIFDNWKWNIVNSYSDDYVDSEIPFNEIFYVRDELINTIFLESKKDEVKKEIDFIRKVDTIRNKKYNRTLKKELV